MGSHLSFAAAAKIASTPFNQNMSGSGSRKAPGLDLSDVEMPGVDEAEDRADMSGVEFESAAPAQAIPEDNVLRVENADQTAHHVSADSFRKNLRFVHQFINLDSCQYIIQEIKLKMDNIFSRAVLTGCVARKS